MVKGVPKGFCRARRTGSAQLGLTTGINVGLHPILSIVSDSLLSFGGLVW